MCIVNAHLEEFSRLPADITKVVRNNVHHCNIAFSVVLVQHEVCFKSFLFASPQCTID